MVAGIVDRRGLEKGPLRYLINFVVNCQDFYRTTPQALCVNGSRLCTSLVDLDDVVRLCVNSLAVEGQVGFCVGLQLKLGLYVISFEPNKL